MNGAGSAAARGRSGLGATSGMLQPVSTGGKDGRCPIADIRHSVRLQEEKLFNELKKSMMSQKMKLVLCTI